MKITREWLAEYVPIDTTSEQLAEKLTVSGTKVEDVGRKQGEDIFEFEITPNRPDTLSVYGLAREIAAVTDQELKPLDTTLAYQPGSPKDTLQFVIKDKQLISAYALAVFDNVQVRKSPEWLSKRLEAAGIRSVNSVVDVTNYAMLETGQPSHAFDFDKIKDHKLILRPSQKGEALTTLDGQKRSLPAHAIVIQDSEELIDLAGLMGGANSEISLQTNKTAVLVPIYNPIHIRRTSQAVNLRTEASNLFEKNLDPLMPETALYRIAKLLFDTSAGRLSSTVLTYSSSDYQPVVIEITLGEVSDHLGITIGHEEFINILTPLGFMVKNLSYQENDRFEVTVPSFRQDVKLTVDIVEEIGRLYGYNHFPKTLPVGPLPNHPDANPTDWEQLYKTQLVSLGANEIQTYTLLSEKLVTAAQFDSGNTLRILNPNSSDFIYLRPSLLPGSLTSAALNLKNYPDILLFEIGKVFTGDLKPLPTQDRQLLVVTSLSFRELKGVLESLLSRFNITPEYQKDFVAALAEGKSGQLITGKRVIGSIGVVDPSVLRSFDIDKELSVFALDFETVTKISRLEDKYQPLPKYPEVKEDLSVVVGEEITAAQIQATINKAGGPLLQSALAYDEFRHESLGRGKKSLTFSLIFAGNRTLTQGEVSKVRAKINKALSKQVSAEIR